MLLRYFSLCSQCRRSFQPILRFEKSLHHTATSERKITGSSFQRRSDPDGKEAYTKEVPRTFSKVGRNVFTSVYRAKKYDVGSARIEINGELRRWVRSKPIQKRLWAMGVREMADGVSYAEKLLLQFAKEEPKESYFPPKEDRLWDMEGIADTMTENRQFAIDRALTRRFVAWALTTKGLVPPHILDRIERIARATNLSHPMEWYGFARQLRRKIVIHVGPTNSGKTHQALRALAAAKNGIYAGPLRLLAHEVFHRFNTGQIVATGADPNDPPEKHIRLCNLMTGEEQKIVSENATLTSCTVEMLSFVGFYDVAVVDEVQMMADPSRGGAWTAAVLGLSVRELHLCGEDTVIPIIQELAKETQDEIVINRYERLTPLVVAATSLKNDLSNVQKGDCVVTFSRTGIFALKQQIETMTGLRCALAYGRLPPEVRNEQAAKFNDPNSGYDVLVGSDAIGMGLNLKVKRIIFETTKKFDGHNEVPLSLSQIKQIGGRAGRFGLHSDPSPGVVTCLRDQDLEVIRRAFSTIVNKPIKRAVIPMPLETMSAIQQVVPQPASFVDIFDIMYHVSSLGRLFTIRDTKVMHTGAEHIDSVCPDLTLSEKFMLLSVPVQWTDDLISEAMVRIMRLYQSKYSVSLSQSLRGLGIVEVLEAVNKLREAKEPSYLSTDSLRQLETLHKLLVCYLWLHYRAPITFEFKEEAQMLKKQTEDAIDYCLSGIVSKHVLRAKSRPDVNLDTFIKEDQSRLPLLHRPPQLPVYESSV